MFWYIFIIIICALVIAASFLVRAMSRRASELNVVETIFKTSQEPEIDAPGSTKTEPVRPGKSRFCFISDVHISMMPVKWGDILTAVKEAEPEFLLITGDLVNKPGDIERAKQFIFTLSVGAEIPVIITLGNHDNDVAAGLPGGKAEFRQEFTSLKGDVRVLDDECTVVGNVLIGGLNDASARERPCAPLIEEWEKAAKEKGLSFVLATHNADLLLEAGESSGQEKPVSGTRPIHPEEDKPASGTRPIHPEEEKPVSDTRFAFCGHTHGGQIRLVRGIEFSLLKKDKLPKQGIFYGRHSVNGFDVYITAGVGCAMFPLRYGTNPEVVVVILSRM